MDGEKELKLAGTRTQAWPEAGPTLQPCSSPGPKVTSLCHIFTPFGAPPGISGCPNSKCWQEGWSSPAQVTHPLRAPKLRPRWQGLRGWGGGGWPDHPGSRKAVLWKGGQAGQVVQKVSINPCYSCRREKKARLLLQPGSRGFVLPLS